MRFTKYFYLVLLVLMTASLVPLNGQGLNPDSLALVALYNSTNGDDWNNNSNWLVPGQSISTWYGVTAKNGQVRKLRLVNNNLNGVLPPELGNLTAMTDLVIYNNKYLRGEIPARLGNARSLVILDLHWNGLSGKVPDELSKLTKLRKLYLYSNKREGISPGFSGTLPPSLDDLPTLYTINIRNNSFSKVPTYSRAPVSTLYMDYNLLTELPDISAFSRMLHLQVQGNQLDFADLLPLVPNNYRIFNYGSQADVGEPYIMPVVPGNPIQISCPQNSDGIVVQWLKDGLPVPGQQQDLFIEAATAADAGSYVCEITHPDLPQLILKSTPVIVHVELTPGQSDSLALVALYDATDGDNWLNNANWKSAARLEEWFGVSVDPATRRVTRISLASNRLAGAVPASIGDLGNLEGLILDHNSLSSIPERIGDLGYLLRLSLSNNSLSSIPECIGDLGNLWYLDLSHNSLSSIPERIGDLGNLWYLDLSHNSLSSIPERIGDLAILEDLRLSYNSLSRLPERIGDLGNLYYMDLSNNSLSSIPERIGDLANLESLYLFNNSLSSIPERIGDLGNLTYLYLNYNLLSSLPQRIGDLENLEFLYLDNNSLNSIPERIGDLARLQTLSLSYNSLNSLPESIGDLGNLVSLYLYSNSLLSLPESIGDLGNLQILYLYDNLLSTIPERIGDLGNLRHLYLHDNSLSSIPERIGDLENLQKLYLDQNSLSSIPERIGDLGNLEFLYLDFNSLNSLPERIGDLAKLERLDLSYNSLNSLPERIGDLGQLEFLLLTSNSLSSIPERIGDLGNLKYLYLYSNLLNSLPERIGDLAKLERLYLPYNSLKSLPVQIGDLSAQCYIDVSSNYLQFGSIETHVDHFESFLYDGQAPIAVDPAHVRIGIGGNYTLYLDASGEHNEYQWYRNNTAVTEWAAENYQFAITGAQPQDGGEYRCQVRNTIATGTILISEAITVEVSDDPLATATAGMLPMPAGSAENYWQRIPNLTVSFQSYAGGELNSSGLAAPVAGVPLYIDEETPVPGVRLAEIEFDYGRRILYEQVTELEAKLIDAAAAEPVYNENLSFAKDLIISAPHFHNVSYQWYHNHQPIAHGHDHRLFLRALSAEIGGEYYCEVGDEQGSELVLLTEVVQVNYAEQPAEMLTLSSEAIPNSFQLKQNFPNPFNPTTTIRYALPQAANVELRVYNIAGQLVRTLINKYANAGYHEAVWDGCNAFGQQVASGVYIYELRAGSFRSHQKMLLVK
jgi:Leucine-rich repeat (LRR) protein